MTLISLLPFRKLFAQTTVYVYPPSQEAPIGASFNVTVKISNVADLYGWEFKLSWNPLIISVTEVVEGNFLSSGGQTYLVKVINNTVGYIHVACTLIGAASGVSGSGVLAIVYFYVNRSGETVLDLYGTKLVNSLEQSIAHEAADGYFSTPLIHDIAITDVTVSKRRVIRGQEVIINATVYNNGTTDETFNLTASYDSYKIDTQTITGLGANEMISVTFIWNTTDASFGNHTLKVEATILPGETNTADNVYSCGNVTIIGFPEASFWYRPVLPHVGEVVTFNASDSIPNGGTIILYEWDFGTGDKRSTDSPITSYTYHSEGIYNVTLKVTDSENLSNLTWRLIYVEVQPTRDVAVINVTISDTQAYIGNIVQISIFVINFGDIDETFTINVYCNQNLVDSQEVINLYPLEKRMVTIYWNTTGASTYQNYSIKAEISPLPDEANLTNNVFVDGNVILKMLGDINCDLKVNYKDLFILASSYGLTAQDQRYDRNIDFNQDGKIDYRDLFILAANYGKKA